MLPYSRAVQPPYVTWGSFGQLDKDVSNMKLKLDHLEAGLRDLKSEMNRNHDKLDKDIKDLNNRVGTKFDRILYAIISGLAGLVVKGGYDYYDQKNERKKLVDQKQPDAVVSAPEAKKWWSSFT